MVNILSFVDKPISGKIIKEWIVYHTSNETEYSRIAQAMRRYDNLLDDVEYYVDLSPAGTGCGEKKRYHPNVIKIKV